MMWWHLALVPAEAGCKCKTSLVYTVSSRPGETSQISKRRERERDGGGKEGKKKEGRGEVTSRSLENLS